MTRLEQLRSQRLIRHFTHSFLDNDLIAAGGEPHQLFVTTLALLAGLGFTLSVLFAFRYASIGIPLSVLRQAHISDNLLVLLITMSVTALLTVIAWDGLLPSRRDAMVLSPFPIRPAAIFRARLFATLLFFAVTFSALVFLPLLALPLCETTSASFSDLARRAAAHLFCVSAAAAFMFFSVILLQAILLAVLPYGRFLQISSLLQILWLLAAFALFFLTPNPIVAVRHNLHWALWLPPYWFLDLWQSLAGGIWPFPFHTAFLALPAAALSVLGALSIYAASYRRALRKAVEGLPLSHHGPSLLLRAFTTSLNATLLRDLRQRAIFWFAARTLFRHRNHRLLLSLYLGLALCWILSSISSVISAGPAKFTLHPAPFTCTIPLTISAALLIGMRVLFSLPVELRANWIFRTSAPPSDLTVTFAARKLLVIVAILPMALAPLPLYALSWGLPKALGHTWFFALESAILLQYLMHRFRKIPFTCSWLPGQGNLRVTLGVYFIQFGAAMTLLGALETAALTRTSPQPFIGVSLFLLLVLAILAWRRRSASSEPWSIIFDEQPTFAANPLHLS
ncbi:MAG: hypothetical protein HY821_20705 [Acidobacteria bacterium]|nr:hypothetical protein [Acidobacteriota bacterium]